MDLETFLWIYLVGIVVWWLLLVVAFGLGNTSTILLKKPWCNPPRKWQVPNAITITGAAIFWLPWVLLCTYCRLRESWAKIVEIKG